MKPYKSVDTVNEELRHIIARMKQSGTRVLPSERQLAHDTQSSVMTVRKALFFLEKQGVFDKSARARVIRSPLEASPVAAAVGKTMAVTFLSSGYDFPSNPEWLRLSFCLSEKLRRLNIDFSVLCLNHTRSEQYLRENMAGRNRPDQVIVFADPPHGHTFSTVQSLAPHAQLIAVDEDFLGKCERVVALNNYQVGRLAAETLLKAGCRNPAMTFCDKGYLPFCHRRDGFLDVISAAGITTEHSVYRTHAPGEPYPGDDLLPDALQKILMHKHDGLFLFADAMANHVRVHLSKHYKIPQEFKLIALDCNGECRSTQSNITAISHATEECATKLVETVVRLSRGEEPEKVQLVTPHLIGGNTV